MYLVLRVMGSMGSFNFHRGLEGSWVIVCVCTQGYKLMGTSTLAHRTKGIGLL